MRISKIIRHIYIIFALALFLFPCAALSDDTCIFSVTTNEVGPNIVLLLDNGAEMEHAAWHSNYKNETDYTPVVSSVWDVLDNIGSGTPPPVSNNWTLVLNTVDESNYLFEEGAGIKGLTSNAGANVVYKTYVGALLKLEVDSITGSFAVGETVQRYKNKSNIATGVIQEIIQPQVSDAPPPAAPNGFFNANGYAAVSQGGQWYLVKILSNLLPDSYANGLVASSGNTWTINGKTVTLPVQASSAGVVDPETGFTIKDNAARLRYSKNYLNWLFFAKDGSGNFLYSGNGSDLSNKSRFYYAKQALMSVAKKTANKASFGIYNFTSTTEGASNVQPLGMVVASVDENNPNNNILEPNYINNINNMGTVNYSPLAEGLVDIGKYYNSPSAGINPDYYCQDQYTIVVSSGIPSKDMTWNGSQLCDTCALPSGFSDFDADSSGIGEGNVQADFSIFPIPLNAEGSTWLDDVSHFLYSNDIVGYVPGFQRIYTYTVGVMPTRESNLFLINTSNNGNGLTNLYDTTDEKYGKYHFTADSSAGLSSAILSAVNAILTNTSTFTAPVVPVTRTLSGNRIYLALFKPGEGNFWEGDVLKFGIDSNLQIVDKNGDPATYPNGALKEGAVPYWSTKNWSDADYAFPDCMGEGCNFIENDDRNIYTYLGGNTDLTHSSNSFKTTNALLTMAVLGNPTDGLPTIINYVRGADTTDEDGDGNITENRKLITGDVLHSEPVVFEYQYSDGSSKTYLFFGSNDGMIHAVYDQHDPDVSTFDDETDHGTEAWGFIPPDQLVRLKEMIEGFGHQFYVDSSPQIYFKDDNDDGKVDTANDKVILICGLRGGGSSYFALDITDPDIPKYMWTVNKSMIAKLGNTWSEPQFGKVKTSAADVTGTTVMFVGGGYTSDNSSGNAVIAINIFDGSVVKIWTETDNPSMIYSIPSTIKPVDEDDNGFVDKLYVGDMGGQVWRIGNCSSVDFPECDENIQNWTAQTILETDNSTYQQKFFYPPSVTLERGYDLVLIGSGDRENPCVDDTPGTETDTLYSFKDSHQLSTFTKEDLVDVTLTSATPPDLEDVDGDVDNNLSVDQGWYINLDPDGEKILAQGTVFYKTLYITSYIPNDDPCLPGGESRLYALNYKTGEAVLSFSGADSDGDGKADLERYTGIGGGIPSKPVMVIIEGNQKLFISVGSTEVDPNSESIEAGIIAVDPLAPLKNFFYLWWQELFK